MQVQHSTHRRSTRWSASCTPSCCPDVGTKVDCPVDPSTSPPSKRLATNKQIVQALWTWQAEVVSTQLALVLINYLYLGDRAHRFSYNSTSSPVFKYLTLRSPSTERHQSDSISTSFSLAILPLKQNYSPCSLIPSWYIRGT